MEREREGKGEGTHHVFIRKALVCLRFPSGGVAVLHVELERVQKRTTHYIHKTQT